MSYELLRVIWWALLGLLLIGFAVMDGFDLGTAMLYPFVARTDSERRVVLNTIGPVWEGNQVWFILGGGAIFAAWPALYAASFSGFYLAMFAVLCALIFRPLSIIYRSKLENLRWRRFWDAAFFVTGVIPSLIFGVAFGNLFLGVPFGFDVDMRMHATITFLSLLRPFPLLGGLVSICMLALQGAAWLSLKADGLVGSRARTAIPPLAVAYMVLFGLAGIWVSLLDGYAMVTEGSLHGPAWTTHVAQMPQAWFANFAHHPLYWFAPALALLGASVALLLRRRPLFAFLGSSLVCAATIASAGLALFPFLLPSSSEPEFSLTVWNASSSKLTLEVMLGAVAIFLPLILAYTGWVYRVMRGPVRAEDVARDHGAY